MRVTVSTMLARTILTRTSGYLRDVSSHSLQPYRGCSFGQSLCGGGCYVQHNRFITKGLPWGSCVVAKTNAAELYARDVEKEHAYANRHGREFGIFMSSSTDPFLPHEARFGITTAVLRAMLDAPPEFLILQTHTHLIVDAIDLFEALSRRTRLRVLLSIESDRASAAVTGQQPAADGDDISQAWHSHGSHGRTASAYRKSKELFQSYSELCGHGDPRPLHWW